MTAGSVQASENTAWAAAAPRLSVVIPFFRYDPTPLLIRLDQEACAAKSAIEILTLDDGGGDKALVERVAACLKALASPAQLLVLSGNEGRAKGRNRLVEAARARHILLIDCDMAPDAPDFLGRYLKLADEDAPVAFGGFSVDRVKAGPEQTLHWAMQRRAECLPAELRRRQPEKYVYTSNLLVRRDVFETEAFDERFKGWGWEDVEWGMRVAARYQIHQIDNTATHLGLDTAEALAGKYEQSVPNFARVVAEHPEIVSGYPSYRLARLLKRAPLLNAWRPFLKRWALMAWTPLMTRIFAMKAYRAALYASVVR